MTTLFKWQHKDYARLSLSYKKPSQVLLLSTIAGFGVDVLISNYVALILCENPVQSSTDELFYPCSTCQSCILLQNDNHPDFYSLLVDVTANQKNISVDDVRNMLEFLSTTTHIGRYKIVFIPDVDLLSINSANALLKVLEEPSVYTLFILQTNNLSGIMPTIRSRCHVYKLSAIDNLDVLSSISRPNITNAEFWLRYYDNAPLFEVPISDEQYDVLINVLLQPSVENIFMASAKFDGKDASFLLGFLTRWLNDLIFHIKNIPLRYFGGYIEELDKISKRANLHKIFYLFDQVNFLEDWATHPLNYKLQLENLLLQYQGLFSGS